MPCSMKCSISSSNWGANDEALDFPVLYASGRAGTASWKPRRPRREYAARLRRPDAPRSRAPRRPPDRSLQIRISSIQYNDYVGRIGVGRINNGIVKTGQQIMIIKRGGEAVKSKIGQVRVFDGFGTKDVEQAEAGDIVALVGLEAVDINDSICDALKPEPLEAQEIEPPTLTMLFTVNDSPFAGREGKYVTSRNLRERLYKELQSNVALKVEESGNKDSFVVLRPRPAAPGRVDREHAPGGV